MAALFRILLPLIAVLVVFTLLIPQRGPNQAKAFDPAVCAGPPLRNVQERNDAMEAGYEIDRRYDCIDKRSFEAVNAEKAAWEQRQAERLATERTKLAEAGQPAFAQARHGFQTRLVFPAGEPQPLPQPPPELFVRSDYKNPQNYRLPGFITPDPQDGRRHPAILWLTGGDSSALDDFWTPGPAANDQSASAFREAGMIMIFPTLRGSHGSRSSKEWLLGEVDDVLAAAEQAARLSYVDPERLYLGGHSTGGTLALLAAALKGPFKAVFAFGPVAKADRHAPALIPADFAKADPMELKLRSPIYWLGDIAQPTYLIEGVGAPGNGDDLKTLCDASHNPLVHCLPVPRAGHFSVLRPATRAIAARLTADPPVLLDTLTPDMLAPAP